MSTQTITIPGVFDRSDSAFVLGPVFTDGEWALLRKDGTTTILTHLPVALSPVHAEVLIEITQEEADNGLEIVFSDLDGDWLGPEILLEDVESAGEHLDKTNPDPYRADGRGIINRMRRQLCCYWPFLCYNQFGEPEHGPIKEIRVRWDGAGVLYNVPSGGQLTSNAVVYPGRPIEIGSLMIEKPLSEVADPLVPENNQNVFEVKQTMTTPNVRNRQVLYTAYLD